MYLLLRQRCSFNNAKFLSRVFLKYFCTTNAQASASGKSLFNWQLLTTLIWPITNTFKTLWKWKSKGAESQIISLWSNFLCKEKGETLGRGSLIDRHRKSTPLTRKGKERSREVLTKNWQNNNLACHSRLAASPLVQGAGVKGEGSFH